MNAESVLANHPGRNHVRDLLARSLIMLNRSDDARKQLSLMLAEDIHRLLDEAVIAIRAGNQAAASRSLAAMRAQFGDAAHYQYGIIESQRGNLDLAFAELDQAWAERDPGLGSLLTDPFGDPLRKDPRYAALLKRLKFPT